MIDPVTCDFETEGIVGNPVINPPKPVGIAVWVPGQEPVYLSFGHPEFEVGDPRYPQGSKNNSTWKIVHEYLQRLRDSQHPLLFHNAPFDFSVWEASFCNARFLGDYWKQLHDTMYLLFLADPYASSLSLKPSSERYLGMPPTEQDDLRAWIVAHVPGATSANFGAFISKAPADLVAPYAIGDVVRTRRLFDLLHPKIVEQGMEEAYDRERELMPILVEGTKRGIRLDRHTLDHHTNVYTQCLDIAHGRMTQILGVDPREVSGERLADAMEAAGVVQDWTRTATGKRSMAKDNLRFHHPEYKVLHEYSSALETCLQTFMRPWLEFSAADGRLHPNWNQVRQPRDDRSSKGTRTGRLSSDHPNFQNVPSVFTDSLGHPLAVPEGLHPLPILRQYCVPDDGCDWLKRDFSSQEIRILAHFEDGALCEAYRANPSLDPHQMAIDMIHGLTGVLYARKDIKITGFSIIYGTGAGGLAVQLGQPLESATQIKAAYLAAMPAVRALMDGVQQRGRSGSPIRTWGGRLYYTEAPGFSKKYGRVMTYEYKLLNYLIQGSAADQTKQAIIDWNKTRNWDSTFLATVHDEINICAPPNQRDMHMATLRAAMNMDRFDVPMLSEGYYGPDWHNLTKME